MRPFVRSRFVPLLAAVCPLLVMAVMVPDAYAQDDAFRRGIDARNDKRYTDVIPQMREAIKQRGQETTNKIGSRLGFGGTEYLPHFFLGEALFVTGDCAGAINEWIVSEQHKAIESRPDLLKILRSGYVECEKKGVLTPARLEAAMARTAQQINEVNALAKVVTGLGQANLDIWRSEAAIREQYDRAAAEIQAANARYTSARTSRAQRDLTEAEEAVGRARGILVKVESSLNAAIDSQKTVQALVRDVTDAIGLAESLNTAVASKKVPFTQGMTGAHQEGRELIGRARERLNEGSKTLSAPVLLAGRTFAQDAATRLRQVLEEISRIERDAMQREFGDALTRAADTFSLLDSTVATLERFSSQRPGVLPADKEAERQAVQRQVTQARRRLDAARKTENAAGVADAVRLAADARDRLNLLIAAFGPLTLRDRGLDPLIEQGAKLFLDGEYQQVVSTLAAGENLAPEVPLRLHVHLFRAAALHALYLRSNESDPSLRTQAVAEVEHSKAIDSTFRPNGQAFSPRFLRFYESVPAPAPVAPPVPAAAPAAQ
jgi:hypothetical protein